MSLNAKYRPQDFSSLFGQKFIAETLQKAVSEDKTVGAYLFCGPRGTGKTTSARIFAKAVNCEGEGQKPCLECKFCRDFAEGKLVDIIEIDAASHTGVDNIREIIERAQFSPTQTKYKIYIIDEVHMLSKGAFNALLKILEEPPEHVKFILATTEVHKIPETILSRCQRYDFKKITKKDIVDRLKYVVSEEGLEADEKALEYIAKLSDGALRNALSLLEQFIIDGEVNYDFIIENLGIVSEDVLDNFLDKLIKGDKSALKDFEELGEKGKNLKLFIKELLYRSRERMFDLVGNADLWRVIAIIEGLNEAYVKSKNSFDEVVPFEIALVKLVSGTEAIVIDPKPMEVVPEAKKEIIQEKKIEKKEPEKIIHDVSFEDNNEIGFDELGDLFDDEPMVEAPPVKSETIKKEMPKVSNNSSSGGFSKDNLIEEVKNAGGNGFVISGLKQANISQVGELITIKISSEIIKSQMKKDKATDALNKAVKSLGQDFTYRID